MDQNECDAILRATVLSELAVACSHPGPDGRSRALLARTANRLANRISRDLVTHSEHFSQERSCVLSTSFVNSQSQHPAAIALEILLKLRNQPVDFVRGQESVQLVGNADRDESGTVAGLVSALIDVLVAARCDDTANLASWLAAWEPDIPTAERIIDRYSWTTRGTIEQNVWTEGKPGAQPERLAIRFHLHIQLYRYGFSQQWKLIRDLAYGAHSFWQGDPFLQLGATIAEMQHQESQVRAVQEMNTFFLNYAPNSRERLELEGLLPPDVVGLQIYGAARGLTDPEAASMLLNLMNSIDGFAEVEGFSVYGAWTLSNRAKAMQVKTAALKIDAQERQRTLEEAKDLLEEGLTRLPGDDDFARSMERSIHADLSAIESELRTSALVDRTNERTADIVASTKKEMEEMKANFETRVRDSQLRAVEVLGIFAAAVAFAVSVPAIAGQAHHLGTGTILRLAGIMGSVLVGFAALISSLSNTIASGSTRIRWTATLFVLTLAVVIAILSTTL